MRRYLRNTRGDAIPLTPFITLALMILLALLMTWISTEITCIEIRNAVKQELTSVSIRITEDSYKAMREGNLAEYHRTLTSDSGYQAELESLVRTKIADSLPLQANHYTVNDIRLTFAENGDNIEYIVHCDVEVRVALFGDYHRIREESIELTGRHNLKQY